MDNQKIRGHAIRGWIYMIGNPVKLLKHYCNVTNGFADCFERDDEHFTYEEKMKGSTDDLIKFFESHDNYWQPRKKNKYHYSPTWMCGVDETKYDLAQGLVCK